MLINNAITFVPKSAEIMLINMYIAFKNIIKNIHPKIFLKKNFIDFQKALNKLDFSINNTAKVRTE